MLLNAGIVAASASSGTPWSPMALSPSVFLEGLPTTFFDAVSGGSLPANGTTIARWEDLSGNTRHATSSNRPTRRSDLLPPLDGVDFTNATNFLSYPVPIANPRNLTVVALYRIRNDSIGPMIWSHRSSLSESIVLYSFGGLTYFEMTGSSGVTQNISGSAPINQWHIVIATLDVPNNTHRLRIDGVLVSTNTYNFGSQTFNSTLNLIGNQAFSGNPASNNGQFLSGEIPLFALFNNTVSQANAERLEGYIAHRVGLANTSILPSGHPYKSVAP